jgi:molybdopterin synthase sulfur carrier subunit
MQIHFFATLRQIVGGKTIELPAVGSLTVRQVLATVITRYPPLRAELLDEVGNLYGNVHVLINGRDVAYLELGLDTAVSADDTVNIFPAVAGGAY